MQKHKLFSSKVQAISNDYKGKRSIVFYFIGRFPSFRISLQWTKRAAYDLQNSTFPIIHNHSTTLKRINQFKYLYHTRNRNVNWVVLMWKMKKISIERCIGYRISLQLATDQSRETTLFPRYVHAHLLKIKRFTETSTYYLSQTKPMTPTHNKKPPVIHSPRR